MELRDLGSLPPTLAAGEAAELLGVGIDHLYALERAGESPVPALRLGRKLRWPTAPLLRAIGFDPERETTPGATPEAVHQIDTAPAATNGEPCSS